MSGPALATRQGHVSTTRLALRPASSNAVILALVIALRDVERRRALSNMESDGTSRRTTA